MKIDAVLQPFQSLVVREGLEPLHLVWDSSTGEVQGPDRERVLGLIKAPEGTPFPVNYRLRREAEAISRPLTLPWEMALLVGEKWILPGELEAHYPDPSVGIVPPLSW